MSGRSVVSLSVCRPRLLRLTVGHTSANTVLPRLALFTGSATFDSGTSFVLGFDLATGSAMSRRLDRLALDNYGPTNLAWSGVLLRMSLGIPREETKGRRHEELTRDDHKAALDLLAHVLRELSEEP